MALRETDADADAVCLAVAAAAAAATARLCREAGRDSDAERCHAAVAAAREGLEPLWRPEQGLYADAAGGGCSQRANGLILAAGAARETVPSRWPRACAATEWRRWPT